MFAVQSPARETIRENSFLVGSGIVAKACHSLSGEWVIRMPVPVVGRATQPTRVSTGLVEGM